MKKEENVKVFYIKFNGEDKSFNKFLSKMVVDFKDFPINITNFFEWFSSEYSDVIIPPTFRMLVGANEFDFIAVYDGDIEFDEKKIKEYLINNHVPYLQCSYGVGDIYYKEEMIDCCGLNKNCLCKTVPIFKTLKYSDIVHRMNGDAIIKAVKEKQYTI